jgi:WD40 repeat protein
MDAEITAATSAVDPALDKWFLAVGLDDGGVLVRDPDKPEAVRCQSKERHTKRVVYLEFSTDHHGLVSASEDGSAILWDAGDCRVLQRFGSSEGGHEQSLYSARFDPTGKRLVTASLDHTAIVWSIDGRPLKRLVGHLDRVYTASFSADGRWVHPPVTAIRWRPRSRG